MFNFLLTYFSIKLHGLIERIESTAISFEKKKKEFKDYIKTDVTFVDPAGAREQSVKAVYPTTYDRYTATDNNGELKYHKPVKKEATNTVSVEEK